MPAREFSLALLQRVVGGDGVRRSDMDELERLALIQTARERGEAGFRFVHALIQETAYRNLLRRTRRELHGRAAEALEAQQAGRLDEAAGTIGHRAQAGEAERAIPVPGLAGDRAKIAHAANDEAITAYQLVAMTRRLSGRAGGYQCSPRLRRRPGLGADQPRRCAGAGQPL